MIPYGRQDISQDDIEAVVRVLQSDWLTQGPAVPRFEEALSEYCGARHAVAVSSATAGLHVACLALGLGPGDILWTSPITFVASANSARYCGASVDFVDIDPRTYNLSVERLAEKLGAARRSNSLPKVVMPVHLCGQSCDMEAVKALSNEFGFRIIEDASHAIGGKYKERPIGDCRYSDVTVFSFHPVKIITSGEGGAVLTNDATLAARLRQLRSHGITADRDRMEPRPANEIWNYQQLELGYNYRMTDIQAALGLSQATRLDQFVAERHRIASRYDCAFAELPVVIPWQHPETYSSYHLYPVRVRASECGKSQPELFESLRCAGIQANVHYIPVYRQPYYEAQGFKAGHCPEAEAYYRETITLPVFPALTESQQDRVIEELARTLWS